MITDTQNLLNLRTASRNVMASMGISDSVNLDFEQRKVYLKTLATEILKYPGSFQKATLDAAADISRKDYGSLQETDFSVSEFRDAFVDQAAEVIPSVGNKLLLAAVFLSAVYITVQAFRNAPTIPNK